MRMRDIEAMAWDTSEAIFVPAPGAVSVAAAPEHKDLTVFLVEHGKEHEFDAAALIAALQGEEG